MPGKELCVVVAATLQWGIGRDGTLPWKLRGDMKHFRKVTTEAAPGKRNAVIVGRATYESIPEKFRPLKNRWNIVLSSNTAFRDSLPADVASCSSFEDAVRLCQDKEDIDRIMVIGGARCIKEALQRPDCQHIFFTRVKAEVPCDTFIEPIDDKTFQENPAFPKVELEEEGIPYEILLLSRKPPSIVD
ncbi:hypothetical protein PTSG_02278 [Salpingoeca rosetta]|uniref:dihydrofolate reductase n=1 Tax=Salpingoeca rosetta (strain ATCC 50818 / BSB-021) TaxID=946362 RepID=F2U1R1_SALR5|nr:uncharacterized protein PTSG_02278 [Salpingoeca rosetta]EGD81563.1 hypothetical protein PTSG_02278 [Salpingoeca rosetta]|eukprot:XP_004996767.1 hypothetical protein PTSG_02278 [Salpingoeca rosetta]